MSTPHLDGYREGYREGYRDGYAQAQEHLRVSSPVAAPAPTVERKPRRKSAASEKDRLVREYLGEHPGCRFRDLSRALGQHVALRVYQLRDRGEVRYGDDGSFRLIDDTR